MTLTLSRGRMVNLRVLGPDGKGVQAHLETRAFTGANRFWDWRRLRWLTDADGRFMLGGLCADQNYELTVSNRRRKLAAQVLLTPVADDAKPQALEVKLQHTGAVTGRVRDENGKAIIGAVARLLRWQRNSGEGTGDVALTDADGKFTLDALVPGVEYSVDLAARGYTAVSSQRLTAQAGKTQALADVALFKADQSITGVVVDAAGKPLVGVIVSGAPANPAVRPGSEQQVTDQEGRFRLTGLPRGPVQMNAVVPWIKDRSFAPGRVQAGQKDVQISLPVPTPRPSM